MSKLRDALIDLADARQERNAACAGTLADAWADETAAPPEHRRPFMAGALAALLLLRAGVPREQLLAECVMFGRTIGSAVDKSTI
jgi:hypothetical protein